MDNKIQTPDNYKSNYISNNETETEKEKRIYLEKKNMTITYL